MTVPVVAITQTGERVTTDATITARSFGEAVFKTSARITRVEIDPDKLFPQLDYANDSAPRVRSIDEALGEAKATLARSENAKAEATARELSASTRACRKRVFFWRAACSRRIVWTKPSVIFVLLWMIGCRRRTRSRGPT